MKKIIAAVFITVLTMSTIYIPIKGSETELNSWKFDFGEVGTLAENGYTLVTPDMHIINDENRNWGFIGTNEKDYRLNGGRIDGFIQQEGQVIELVATENGIGSMGIRDKTVRDFNSGDYYPVRFALKVPDETYYKVKVTVTTLDATRPAVASLYTERKHPIFTKKEVKAGEAVTAEFTVRVTPVYYEKSDPKGLMEDGYVNVCLLGDNAALSKIEIEQIETAPTLWILGDSTVTDGGGVLPFFPLQNYTGVGTGTTKYLPADIAMVNEGEGGLSAHDNYHFNTVKSRLKEGDFLWVEYGHNHKTDGAEGYKGCLEKYYNACKEAKATLILVGPIDRINWYNAVENKWNSSLKAFSDTAKAFVDEKLEKNPDDKIAFVDLNEPSLEWFGKITSSGVVGGNIVKNEARLVHFYFQGAPGAKDVDHTHPNDAGAENLAYLFFENADTDTYPALKPILKRYEDGEAEKPNPVDEKIVNMGYPANEAWPVYSGGVNYEYPLVITKVNINENNRIESLTCKLLDKNLLTSYAAGFVEINSVTYQTTIESHIDNSAANNGSIYTVKFSEDNLPYVEDGESFRAYMAGVDMADNDKRLEGSVFSKDYEEQEIEAYIIPGPDGEIENFDYYGYNTLTGSGDWFFGGSAPSEFVLGSDADKSCYTTIKTTDRGSFSLNRALENLPGGISTSGRYLFGVDIKVEEKSEGGLQFTLANGWRDSEPFALGETLALFEINETQSVTSNGKIVGNVKKGERTRIECVLDTDAAVMIVSVDGNEEHVFNLPQYEGFETPVVASYNNIVITTKNATGVDMKLYELTGIKYNLYDNIKSILRVNSEEGGAAKGTYGTAYIGKEGVTELCVNAGEIITLAAIPTEDGRFIGWYMDNILYSTEENIQMRMYKDATLTARFAQQTPESDVVVNYVDAFGRQIKESDILIVDDKGKKLHEEMIFVLNDSYKNTIKKENNGYYDVYFFKGTSCERIESLGKRGTNVINLIFDYDGAYFEYEDFENIENAWGFMNEAAAGEGVLNLLTGVGTNNRTSSVKNVSDEIAGCKKLTVRFDWRNTVDTGKGRISSFELLDEEGKYIFSINAKGKSGLDYGIGKFADTAISSNWSGVNDWYGIVLTLDFENGTVSGGITNKTTGAKTEIAPVQIEAKNLTTIRATYGYSSASQQLDNFGFRDDTAKIVKTEIVKKDGTKATLKIESKESGKYGLFISVYEDDKLLRVVTQNVELTEDIPQEVCVDTKMDGEIEVMVLKL